MNWRYCLAENNLVALGVVEDQREELVSADHESHGHIDILFAELGVDAGLTQQDAVRRRLGPWRQGTL